MFSLRFTNREQKQANLAILRDLLIDHKDDQPAKTALSNAIAMAEATMFSGELDELIARTNRMMKRGNIFISLCFSVLIAFQIAMGYYWSWANYFSAFATATYMVCLWINWRIQQRYYTQLKWLEGMQLDMPTIPRSLMKAVN